MTLLELGAAANAERERRHGNKVYFSLAALPVYWMACAAGELEALLPPVPHVAVPQDTLAVAVPQGTRAVAVAIVAGEGATTGEAEMRAVARARLALADVDHVAADWTRLTPYMAQVALRFGADVLTGIPLGTPRQEVVRLITEAGREPFECDALFEAHQAVWESALPVLHS